MHTLASTWKRLHDAGERALVAFITAGDPDLADLPMILDAIVAGGADIIEIGLPFSDPIADGPVIQASSQRALDRGVKISAILGALSEWQNPGVPIVLMGYYNSILRLGLTEFARLASEAGACGTIISDLTPEESDDWVAASRTHELENIFLVAPTSTKARIAEACKRASGFVYAVSRIGVTGSAQSASPEVESLVQSIRKHTELPICVGFGISKPEHIQSIVKFADGAVVGSSIVKLIDETWNNSQGADQLTAYVRTLKSATTA